MIIFGLGNPGEQYEETRHNVGFTVLDRIQKDWSFPDFKFNKKFNAEITEKNSTSFIDKLLLKDKKLFLVKPQTFMNLSGETVGKMLSFYKKSPKEIIVIHDDLDIPIGKYKISENSSSGGHNGIQNIIDTIGTKNFIRIRIGIEQENGRQARKISGQKFVLQKFQEGEMKKINSIIGEIENDLKNILK